MDSAATEDASKGYHVETSYRFGLDQLAAHYFMERVKGGGDRMEIRQCPGRDKTTARSPAL